MPHFTYAETVDKTTLGQGDLIAKTEELSSVLKEIHPYFDSASYSHFIVLTQSCDLVMRNQKCKTRYISIAAVRSLDVVMLRESEGYRNTFVERSTTKFIDDKTKTKLSDFLSKLYNNNSSEYFYLHSDLSLGISDPLVAVLRVSIALKANEHYDTCLKCKVLELTSEFKAKLGWLVGNVYSRVGTEDWVPKNSTQKELTARINQQIQSNFVVLSNSDLWDAQLKSRYTEEQFSKLTVEEVQKIITDLKVQSKKERAVKRIADLLIETKVLKDDNLLRKITISLTNDPELSNLLPKN